MPDKHQTWLVEIRLKDWIHCPGDQSRTIDYEEVVSADEVCARFAGFDQFERRATYEPKTRAMMHSRGIALKDCCAPEAVAI